MKTYEFDVVTDEVPLDATIDRISEIGGVIAVEVLSEANNANGWPTIKVTLNESAANFSALAEIFPDYEQDEQS